MRYLKKFNESESNNIMLNLAIDSMIDIMDKGFEISISQEKSDKAKYYDCILVKRDENSYSRWDDIEDDVIKFMQLSSDAYTIESIEIEYRTVSFYNTVVVMPREIESRQINDILKSNLKIASKDYTGRVEKEESNNIFIQTISFYY